MISLLLVSPTRCIRVRKPCWVIVLSTMNYFPCLSAFCVVSSRHFFGGLLVGICLPVCGGAGGGRNTISRREKKRHSIFRMNLFFRPPQYPACQAGLASPNPSVEGLNRGRGGPTSRPSKVRPTEPVPLRGWPWFLTGGNGLPVVCPHRAMREVPTGRRQNSLSPDLPRPFPCRVTGGRGRSAS